MNACDLLWSLHVRVKVCLFVEDWVLSNIRGFCIVVRRNWIQFTTYFIECLVVETIRFVGSTVNVILTRQTSGQRSSRAAQSKRRALDLKISFPFEFAICFKYQNVEEIEIEDCAPPKINLLRNCESRKDTWLRNQGKKRDSPAEIFEIPIRVQ